MRIAALAFAAVLACSVAGPVRSADPGVLVMSASEDAGGTTQADFDLTVLRMLERRSVEMLATKMRDYLRAQGQSTQLPKLEAQSHYVESGGIKLAVVRVLSPKVLNQVFVYGINGNAFLRVACTRTNNFEQAIPLFYGPCGDKLREVFGVSINPR